MSSDQDSSPSNKKTSKFTTATKQQLRYINPIQAAPKKAASA